MHTRHSFLIALAMLVQPGCTGTQDDRLVVPEEASDPPGALHDVTFATFTIPKGWTANRSDKNTYAILSRSNESYPNLSQMISIDIGTPVAPTLKASADGFATTWGGRVEDASLGVDGEMAFRVTCPPDNETVRPIDCVVMMKEGRLFMLIGGAREAGELNAAIDEIVASWKWKNSNEIAVLD